MRLQLGNGVTLEADQAKGLCITRYADGYECHGTRDDTPDNRREAADQGYTGDDALWLSLFEHELAHTVVARHFFGRESYVMRHESGAEYVRYPLRLHEEALCLSLQRFINTGFVDPVLEHTSPRTLLLLKREIRPQ